MEEPTPATVEHVRERFRALQQIANERQRGKSSSAPDAPVKTTGDVEQPTTQP
jgi:hypothetical protein